jgi:cell division septal protein FtsQ
MILFKRKKDDLPRRRLDVDGGLSDSFKRNQTLSGATINTSQRQTTHHLAIKRRKVLSIFLIVLMSALILWLLINNITAKVSIHISSSTNSSKIIDKSNYEKTIQEYLDNNPISRLRFFIDKKSLNAFVISKLPEVDSVSQAGTDGLGVSIFDITIRTPVAGWLINNKQYYVDGNGVSFNVNYFEDPGVQIIDQNSVSLQSGDVVVSQRFLSFVGLTVAQVKNSGYTVIQAIMPTDTTRELELKLKECDYLVKLSIDRPVGEQVEDMTVALKYFANNEQKPQYIDVRVSGKAFYR